MIEQSEELSYWNGIPTFLWKRHHWIKRPLWGIVHEQDDLCWIDSNLPSIQENGDLILPFVLEEYKERLIGRSFVRSVEEFKYGTFEWRFIMPKGQWLWPALWLGSDAGWPPEIDCMEGWSEDEPNYIKGLLYKNIKPTMHWSSGADEKTGTHLTERKHNLLRCIIKGDGKENSAKVVWTPNYVDIYYNGIKIKRFKNPEMLKHFNKENYKMHIIMSMGPYGEAWKQYALGNVQKPIVYNDFVITDFKYSPLK